MNRFFEGVLLLILNFTFLHAESKKEEKQTLDEMDVVAERVESSEPVEEYGKFALNLKVVADVGHTEDSFVENKFEKYSLQIKGREYHQLAEGEKLLVSQYLKEVRTKGEAFPLVKQNAAASKILSKEGDLYFSPLLKGEYNRIIDYTASWNQILLSSFDVALDAEYGDLNFQQQTPFGINWKATLSYYKTDLNNESPFSFEDKRLETLLGSRISSFSYGIAIEHFLWRNWMGKELKAKASQRKYSNLKDMYESFHEMKGLIVQAQMAYWELSIARQRLEVYRNIHLISRNFSEFVGDKKERYLAISLQNQIANSDVVKQELAIEKAVIELKEKEDKFNRLRGASIYTPIPEVKSIEPFVMLYKPSPVSPENFKQKQQKMNLHYLEAKVDEGLEKLKPELKWFAVAKGTSRKKYDNDPVLTSGSTEEKPEYLIGIK